MCSEGLISRITVIDLSELEVLIEDIQWLFDDTISIEALVGDYIAGYAELDSATNGSDPARFVDSVAGLTIQDYETGGLFVALTAEHLETVVQALRLYFQTIAEKLNDNDVDLSDVPAWQLVGMRGTSHVVLAQARTGFTSTDIQNTIDDINEANHASRSSSKSA